MAPSSIEIASSSHSATLPTSVNASTTFQVAPSIPGTPTCPSSPTPLFMSPAPSPSSTSGRRRFQDPVSIASAGTGAGVASINEAELEVGRRPWTHNRSGLLSPSQCSNQFFDDGPSPYDVADLEAPRPFFSRTFSDSSSVSSRFSLLPDPSTWGSATYLNDVAEPDDELHNPDPNRDQTVDKGGTVFTSRGLLNLGCLILLITSLIGLFAGFPLTYYFTHSPPPKAGNSAKVNSTGQVPVRAVRRFILDDLGR